MTTTSYAGGLTRSQVSAWRNALFVIFAMCGIAMASWASRLPSVRDTLHISTLEVGVLILAISIGSIIGLLASSHIVSRLGAQRTIMLCFVAAPLGFALAGLGVALGVFPVVFAGLLVFGTGFSICDVSMNLSGAANERVLRRTIMPIYHAFFSFGTMIGAGLGALAEALHVPVVAHLAATAIIMFVAVQLAARALQSEHLVDDEATDATASDNHGTWRDRLKIWRDPRTLIIGLIVLGMAFAEGSANDWIPLASVDGHGVDKPTGALIFGIFVTAMTVARLGGVFVLDKFGRVPVLRVSAALAFVGLAIFIWVPDPVISTIGVVLWGLGSALGFPVGFSAAADDPKVAAARVSAVATIGYFAFLIGPPLIGFLGEHFGILNALIIVLVLIAISGLVSGGAREPAKPAPAAAAPAK
jgi:fucose permease